MFFINRLVVDLLVCTHNVSEDAVKLPGRMGTGNETWIHANNFDDPFP